MDNTNFLKIVYFDEAFVADFMQIIAGGELKKTTEFITEVNSGIEGTAGIEGGIGTEKKCVIQNLYFFKWCDSQCRSECKYRSFEKVR